LQWNREREAWAAFAPFLMECEEKGLPGLLLQEGVVVVPLLHLAVDRKFHIDFARRMLDQIDTGGRNRPVLIPETGETLTPREVEVLRLISSGASNQMIAQQLVISEHTVKVHITNLYAKLGVKSRTQAVAYARKLHLIPGAV
jgi:ATP/maltotriose-dependent transcriptional regulator MalT